MIPSLSCNIATISCFYELYRHANTFQFIFRSLFSDRCGGDRCSNPAHDQYLYQDVISSFLSSTECHNKYNATITGVQIFFYSFFLIEKISNLLYQWPIKQIKSWRWNTVTLNCHHACHNDTRDPSLTHAGTASNKC